MATLHFGVWCRYICPGNISLMAVELNFIDKTLLFKSDIHTQSLNNFKVLIVPIDAIEKHYPGGFKAYISENAQWLGSHIWHDDFIVRTAAAQPRDIDYMIKTWEFYGLMAFEEVDREKYWKDLCVIEPFNTISVPCPWLLINQHTAVHINDTSDNIIGTANFLEKMVREFDENKWLTAFKTASKNKQGFRELRALIYSETVGAAKAGKYETAGIEVEINTTDAPCHTHFFEKPEPLVPFISTQTTLFTVLEADCAETAALMQSLGYNVCLLNMASEKNPGGSVISGAGAQEENLFRRSNLFQSLYQFADYGQHYLVEKNTSHSYPFSVYSGIYSQKVTFFRASENQGYRFLKQPYQLSVITVAAISNPFLDDSTDEIKLAPDMAKITKEKIRVILRIGGKFEHNCLVLSAFGCGAFGNPPGHMAQLFKEVFNETEFKNRFASVIFAIVDDHNSRQEHNPVGNVLPFAKVFD